MPTTLHAGDHGPAVLALQKLLVHNVTGRRCYFGALDGDFGPLTRQACTRAKWVLGYVASNCDPVAGPYIVDFLSGKKAATAAMKTRAVARAKPKPKPPAQTMQERAWADMHAHLGEHELPAGSNHCPDTVEWGHGDMPWCGVRCSLAYIHAGETEAFSRPAGRFQYVPAIVECAQQGHYGLSITKTPRRGDLVIWNYPGGSGADHVTMFGEWVYGGTLFSDIGGNEGQSGVCKADVNHVTFVRCFVHVGR